LRFYLLKQNRILSDKGGNMTIKNLKTLTCISLGLTLIFALYSTQALAGLGGRNAKAPKITGLRFTKTDGTALVATVPGDNLGGWVLSHPTATVNVEVLYQNDNCSYGSAATACGSGLKAIYIFSDERCFKSADTLLPKFNPNPTEETYYKTYRPAAPRRSVEESGFLSYPTDGEPSQYSITRDVLDASPSGQGASAGNADCEKTLAPNGTVMNFSCKAKGYTIRGLFDYIDKPYGGTEVRRCVGLTWIDTTGKTRRSEQFIPLRVRWDPICPQGLCPNGP
jgi:hypothetical protein